MELHGGRLTVTSDGEGKGSTFTVYLPARETDVSADASTLSRDGAVQVAH